MPSFEQLRQELSGRNYAKIPISISRREFYNAAEAFFAFLRLPRERKHPLHFFLDADEVTEVGYFSKSSEDGRSDDKEFFHYHPVFLEKFDRQTKEIPELSAFISAADDIYTKAQEAFQKVIREFDTPFPGVYDKLFPQDAPALFPLRFLKYHTQGKGKFLAKGHYDRGVATPALAESAPGLRIGRSPEELEEIVHEEKTAVFMPALYFPDITSDEFIPAWHDVVQKEEDGISEDTARWAIVMFGNFTGMEHPSFEAAHTPQRDY